MRHRKQRGKLSMMGARRKATVKNMVRSLIIHQRITMTLARAKVARRLAEHLITISKTDSVAARRHAYVILGDRDLVAKLFNETAPLFKARQSGFTRIIPLGFRRGDGATMAILELTEKKIVEKVTKKKKKGAGDEKAGAPAETKPKGKAESQAAAPGAAQKERAAQPEEGAHPKKEEHGPKAMPKARPTLADEKRAEKARAEDRKAADKRSFMKNLRGLFRKRGDF